MAGDFAFHEREGLVNVSVHAGLGHVGVLVNPRNGVIVGTAVGFLFSSGDLEAVLVPTQPSGPSIEETDVGVAEP